MSLLLRPKMMASDVTGITACAAVAVAEEIERLSGRPAEIKWVNDVYMGGKKVCGILTEASIDCESGMVFYLIVGIGINTLTPDADFPAELREIAGSVFEKEQLPELRCRIAAGVLHIKNARLFWGRRSISSHRGESRNRHRCWISSGTILCSSAVRTAVSDGSIPERSASG